MRRATHRLKTRSLKWWSLAVTLTAATASAAPVKIESVLPLKRIRLYETGVGYFERTGRLRKGLDVSLPMPAGHLDDALETLVVLGAHGKTSVAGVEFPSAVSRSMARALAGLPKQSGPLGFVALLDSMKGAEVTLRTRHDTLHGRVVDVLKPNESDLERCVPPAHTAKKQHAPCVMQKQTTLVLLTDHSAVRRFATSDIVSVRPDDSALRARLNAALGALSARGAQTRKVLHLMASGSRKVTIGYIAETPVWRSTYRLVLDDRGRAALQGWALIHNDTDENWRGVHVELVNGRPDSFLFPLAGPRYARRPLVTPEHELSSVPQLLDTTVDNMWTGDQVMGLTGEGAGGGGEGEEGEGYGVGVGRVGTVGGGGSGSSDEQSSLLSVGNLASFAQASGIESGALFRYSLRSPIDLGAHSSALVPFTQNMVPARRIAWFSGPDTTARSAVLLKNDTQQTLPPGPVSVFADGGFAGESALDRVEPGEQRFVRFGADLDVKLELGADDVKDHVELVSFDGNNLLEHFVRHHVLSYEITNQSRSPRTVYLVLDLVQNATVHGADEMAFDSKQGKALAVFHVKAQSHGDRTLSAEEGLSHRYPLSALTSSELDKLAKQPALPAAARPILRAAADRLLEAEVRRGALPKRKAELAQVRADIVALRDNVRAIGTAHDDAAELMTKRLLAAQDRERALEHRIEALGIEAKARVESARAELGRLNATLPAKTAAR